MLDRDLAELYGVETKALNRAVKRNIERFPERFMFQLTKEECLRCQFGTLNEVPEQQGRGQHMKYLPYVFTEQGVSMLSAVLKSPTAVKVCITIMDAFVTLRNQIVKGSDIAAEVADLRVRLARLERDVDRVPRASRLAAGIRVGTYSDKALVIFTENTEDVRLLLAIGARFNPWLMWQGCRTSGWIYPKSQAERLIDILPQEQEWKTLIRHIAHYKKRRS